MTDLSQDQTVSDDPKDLRTRLGAEANRATEAENEAATLRRELAVERAGLPDFPGKQFFLNAYDGEATPEAVKAAAAEAGFISAEGAPVAGSNTDQQVSQELNTQRQIVGASAGGQTPPAGEDLTHAIRGAKSSQDVLRIVNEASGLPNVNFVPEGPI